MIIRKLFGSRNNRLIKKMQKTVDHINNLESKIKILNDYEIQYKTTEFKQKLKKGYSLEDILPEAFAVVREVSKRVKGMRHYDVQIIAGIVLHYGKIAEMATGEGKTLAATLAAYLNALTGNSVHIVTVNDYLASRDAEMMSDIYQFLGLTTGLITHELSIDKRKKAYASDIVYATNNELGFDFLRDNMVLDHSYKVQKNKHFVIIDEIDSILIDEARTPLIISGVTEDTTKIYYLFNKLVPHLIKQENSKKESGDFYLDEKSKKVFLTEKGHKTIEQYLIKCNILNDHDNLYSAQHISNLHYCNASLQAHHLYHKNIDYIIKNNKVIIIDENTGRAMDGRRWSDGLHQAIEAKESLKINNENQTLASITFQNYFKLYNKMSGMTGTADTESTEFYEIYNLEVVVIPQNRPIQRKDYNDRIFEDQTSKFNAIVNEIKKRIIKDQPVLVGTTSIKNSEYLSNLLTINNIKHEILNAKKHAREAAIIAQAGYPGNVTIATNMAGRGTDIILGGNWEREIKLLKNISATEKNNIKINWNKRHEKVIKAGGLFILGSERHDSRRIDNQLIGRAGRQGDPGESCFFLSIEDKLLRIFSSNFFSNQIKKTFKFGQSSLQFEMMSRFIAKSQSKVEQYHFEIRKNLFEYDNIIHEQRLFIYKKRDEYLLNKDFDNIIKQFQYDVINILWNKIKYKIKKNSLDFTLFDEMILNDFYLTIYLNDIIIKYKNNTTLIFDYFKKHLYKKIDKNIHLVKSMSINNIKKIIVIQSLDSSWKEHLNAMENLKQSIHLRSYAQKNPHDEYKKDSFILFSSMLDKFKYDCISNLTKINNQHIKKIQHKKEYFFNKK